MTKKAPAIAEKRTSMAAGLSILEQIIFTSQGLTFLAFSILFLPVEIASKELAIIAILNFAVPFHAVTAGWRRDKGTDEAPLVPALSFQMLILVATAALAFWVTWIAQGSVARLEVAGLFLAATLSVLSSQSRWSRLQAGGYYGLVGGGAAALAGTVATLAACLYQGIATLIPAFIASRAFFMGFVAVCHWRSGRRRFFDFRATDLHALDILLAIARYGKAEGAFVLASQILAPETAIIGRIFQKIAAVLRTLLNPLGNLQYMQSKFSKRNFLALICISMTIYTAAAIVILLWSGSGLDIGFMVGCLLATTVGFLAAFSLRMENARPTAIFGESLAASVIIGTVTFVTWGSNPLALGIILAEISYAIVVLTRRRSRSSS